MEWVTRGDGDRRREKGSSYQEKTRQGGGGGVGGGGRKTIGSIKRELLQKRCIAVTFQTCCD